MKALKKLTVVGLATLILGCSPKYERADLTDLISYPVQYINRYVEVQGKTLDPNNGLLALGDYYISPAIETDLRNDKERRKKLIDIIHKHNLPHPDRIVVKGRFNSNRILEIRGGFVEAGNKRYNFWFFVANSNNLYSAR